MASTILTVLAVLFIGLCTAVYSKRSASHAWRREQKPRGCQQPARYPYLSWRDRHLFVAHQTARQDGRGMIFEQDLFAKLGHTWEETRPDGGRLINISNVENIKHVLSHDVHDFEKGGGKASSHHFLGPGAMISNGAEWRAKRDRIKPTFQGAELRDLTMLQHHVDQLIAVLPKGGSTIDLQILQKLMFFDSLSKFVFGKSAETLSNANDRQESDQLLCDFDVALSMSLQRLRAGFSAC